MFRLKDIFYGIKSRKNTSILIVILLTLTLSISYSIFRTYLTGIILSSDNKWALNNIDDLYLVMVKSDHLLNNSKDYKDALGKLSKENSKIIASFSSFGFEKNPFGNRNFTLSGLAIDKNYYDLIKDELLYGPGFSDTDFNIEKFEVIPIILGEDLKGNYKVNNIIEDSYSNKFIIKGFMKSNKYLPVDSNDLTIYFSTKDCILTPASKSSYPLTCNIVNLEDKTINDFKSDNFDIINFKESIKSRINDDLAFNKRWMPYVVIALAVALLGLVISNLLAFIFRKREIGIRIILGESLKKIALNFTYENLLLGCIAIIVNIGFTYLSNINYIKNMQMESTKVSIDINFNFEFYLISIIIIVLLNLINSVFIYKILKKSQPKDLIGGIE